MKATVRVALPTGVRLPSDQHIEAQLVGLREAAVTARLQRPHAHTHGIEVDVELDIELDVVLTTKGIGVSFAQPVLGEEG